MKKRIGKILFFMIVLLLMSCDNGTTASDFFVSDTQEKELGAKFYAGLKDTLAILPSTDIRSKWVDSVGHALAREQDRRNFTTNDFHFFVVDEPIVNAFATPGGYIYIYQGILDRAATADEIAGVIGHEIGHVAAKHYKEQVAKIYGLQFLQSLLTSRTDNPIILTSAQIGQYLTQMKMSRNNESQADSLAIAYVTDATSLNFNPLGMAHFLDTLGTLSDHEPSMVEKLVLTHPYAPERSDKVEKIIEGNSLYKTASSRSLTPKPRW